MAVITCTICRILFLLFICLQNRDWILCVDFSEQLLHQHQQFYSPLESTFFPWEWCNSFWDILLQITYTSNSCIYMLIAILVFPLALFSWPRGIYCKKYILQGKKTYKWWHATKCCNLVPSPLQASSYSEFKSSFKICLLIVLDFWIKLFLPSHQLLILSFISREGS